MTIYVTMNDNLCDNNEQNPQQQQQLHSTPLLLHPGSGAEYCNQPVCLSVSLCVCLSVCEHIICETAGLIFMKFSVWIPVAVARSPSGGVAIRHLLPVLWMTSRLAVMGATLKGGSRHSATAINDTAMNACCGSL